MKAEMLTFPTAQVSTQNPIWLRSYVQNNQGHVELGSTIVKICVQNCNGASIGDPIQNESSRKPE